MRHQHRSTTAAALAFTLVLSTGCTGDSNQDQQATPSPLAEHIGLGRVDYGLRILDPDGSTTQTSGDTWQSIAECMDEQGHQYTPPEPTETPETSLDLASRDYAETWGYGITTLTFSQEQVGPHLLGYTSTEPADDPNIVHVNALEPDQKTAWIEALTGTPPDDPAAPVTADDLAPTTDPGGCQAQTAPISPGPQAFYTAFGDDLADLRRQVLDDPRSIEHHDNLAACVEAEGVDYTPPHELYQRWGAELTAIADDITHPTSPGTGPGHLSATGKARLKVVQDDEISLATIAWDCGGDPTTNTALYTSVAAEHEQRFVDTHQDELDTFLDSQQHDQG